MNSPAFLLRKLPLVAFLLACAAAAQTQQLTSGIPYRFQITASSSPRLYTGVSITVPVGATRLELKLTMPGVQFQLGLRYNRAVPSTTFDVDHSEPVGTDTVVVTTASNPPLRSGTYYIGVVVLSADSLKTGDLVATVSSPPATTTLTSGVPARFEVAASSSPVIYIGYTVVVPAGATRLEVKATLPSVQFQLGLRYNEPIPSTTFTVDHSAVVGVDTVVVTPASNPPLRSGTYYVGLFVPYADRTTTGELLATVSTAPAAAPTLTAPATLDFGSVTVGASKELTLSIRNTGTAALSITRLSVSDSQFAVLRPSTPFTVAPSAETLVAVRFQPTAAGARSSTLTIASNDPTRPSLNIALSGSGTAPVPPPISTTKILKKDGQVVEGEIQGRIGIKSKTTTVTAEGKQYNAVFYVLFDGKLVSDVGAADVTVGPGEFRLLTVSWPVGGTIQPPSDTQALAKAAEPMRSTVEFLNFASGAEYAHVVLRGSARQTISDVFAWPSNALASTNVPSLQAKPGAGNILGELSTDGQLLPALRVSTSAGAVQLAVSEVVDWNGAAGKLPVITSVINGASYLQGIAAGSWITIRGTDLASTSRIWTDKDIVEGRLPTELEGVSVRVNNRDAAIYYISPTQINALAPADQSTGSVSVTVKNALGTSSAASTVLQTHAPGFFAFDPQNRKYPAAIHADGTYAGPPNLFGSAATTRPARPGDVILLFGTGFGPTDPAADPSRDNVGAAPLVTPNDLRIRIGNVQATVHYAGLAGNGLYQFNVAVPEVADGDQPLIAEIGGQRSQAGLNVYVQRPPRTSTVSLQRYVMTKPRPPSCTEAIANPPTAYTSFATTEPEAYLWFYVRGTSAGDVGDITFYSPNGAVFSTSAWPPIPSAGSICFTSAPLRIAGERAASLPGAWTVRVRYNGEPLFNLPFNIGQNTEVAGAALPLAAPVRIAVH